MVFGIDVNPNGRHWSLLSFRFPQCVSLREESNSRTTFRFNALMMPMRAIIGARVAARPTSTAGWINSRHGVALIH
jgi:hypothetical protein